jgi:hypothetical protein
MSKQRNLAARLAALAGVFSVMCGCSAVYPEMQTAVRALPSSVETDPAPAEDLYFIYFEGATIPPKNQGGLPWPGGAPDPFAKLIVDDVDLIVTPTQSKTLKPTWPKQDKENYRIHPDSKIYIEVWHKNAMRNLPICRVRVSSLSALRAGAENEFWCEGGGRVRLHVEPPRGVMGIGLYYETRGHDGVRVTRVLRDSPSARAGLGPGDRILAINGAQVAQMDALQVRSKINQHARTGLELDVWFANGKRHLVSLKEGAIYPLRGDNIELTE